MATKYLKSIFPKLFKLLSAGVLAVFLMISFFGMFDCRDLFMGTAGMSHMSSLTDDCPPVMAQKGPCNMNVLQHLSAWQGVFRVDVQSHIYNLLIAAVVIFGFWLRKSFPLETVHDSKPRWYLKIHCGLKLYNYLVRLLARGLLQQRVYA